MKSYTEPRGFSVYPCSISPSDVGKSTELGDIKHACKDANLSGAAPCTDSEELANYLGSRSTLRGMKMTPAEARALLAGPFGLELMRFPLRFTKPAFFGIWPHHGEPLAVNNGSASLIRRGEEHFAITCHHVLDGFRQTRAESQRAFFQIGNCRLDPLVQLAEERERPDVAVIRLSTVQAAEITRDANGIGEAFLMIEDARPELVPERTGIAFGGFPGDLRLQPRVAELNFGSYSCGATPVTASGEDYLVCQFDRAEWVLRGYEPEPATIGGISGCPVLRIHESEAGIISHQFAGIVYEYSQALDLLYIVQAAAIYDLMGW